MATTRPPNLLRWLTGMVFLTISFITLGVWATPTTGSSASRIKTTAPSQLVALLTDFGEKGYLLGALKGTIYAGSPGVRIDSISNNIGRFDVEEGGYVLALAAGAWPKGTVFVGVISPDHSGPRPAIAVKSKRGHYFVAPDNGLLTQVALRYGIAAAHAINIEDPSTPSREIFGHAAAKLARGMTLAELGPKVEGIHLLNSPNSSIADSQIQGEVSLIDRFGNVVTNIDKTQLTDLGMNSGHVLDISIGSQRMTAKLVENYGDVAPMEPLASINSHGHLRLSLNQGDLATTLSVTNGASVVVQKQQ